MKTLLTIAALCFLPVTANSQQINSTKPSQKDWVCWSTGTQNPACGTYGWSTSKKTAIGSAQDLCEVTCGTCKVDYCEKAK